MFLYTEEKMGKGNLIIVKLKVDLIITNQL